MQEAPKDPKIQTGTATPRRRALVLSGGGARGAYEVGVLSYLFSELPRWLGAQPKIDVICGTSVGAINGSYLTAHMAEPVSGVRRLVDMWTSLEIQNVLRFPLLRTLRLPKVLRGGGAAEGIFDVSPLIELVTREVSWRAVHRSIASGHVMALSVSATEIATGRTTVFMDAHRDIAVPVQLGPRTRVVKGPIGPQHALASAAIPLVFPPVQMGQLLYCDGGLRQNTPMAPALRLGADRLLVVGLSREVHGNAETEDLHAETRAPGATFLLGKLLNAFLLDHVQSDLELLARMNGFIDDGIRAYGPQFVQTLAAASFARGGESLRKVHTEVVRPSEDLGRIAGEHVRTGKLSGTVVTRKLLQAADLGNPEDSDLVSYLLFDGPFARKLIELGRADAHARREQLVDFFRD